MTTASFIPDAGSVDRPRVLLADDHPAMLALTTAGHGRSRFHALSFQGRARA